MSIGRNSTPAYGPELASYNIARSSSTYDIDRLGEFTASYKKQLGRHHVDALIGYTLQRKTYDRLGVQATGFADDRIHEVTAHGPKEMCIRDRPNTVVRLENGYLYVDELENCDEYLWTEGILSFRNDSFDEVVEKLRKYYDVEIEIRCATLPKVAYGRLKIRISEGIEHALRVLQLASDFTYEYDHDRNRICLLYTSRCV